MNRVSSLVTRIRPIKKLFLIEEKDIDLFINIIQSVSLEVSGISNLILTNSEDLFSERMKNFVNYHDPDVVINHTSIDNNVLQEFFKVPSYSGNDAKSVSKDFSTPFYTVDNLPYGVFCTSPQKGSIQNGAARR